MKKIIILCFVLSLLFGGCAGFQRQADTTPPDDQEDFNQAFYGFPDVPIPKELKMVNDRSFVYEAPGLKAGVITFSGNVDVTSLENYFRIHMPKNGWRYVNSFRYKDIVLNYVKADKTCNIKISRGAFQTELEVWVGPAERDAIQRPAASNGLQ